MAKYIKSISIDTKHGSKEIGIILRTSEWWSQKGIMMVNFSDTYEEKIKGDMSLLHDLYNKFDQDEAYLFLERAFSELKRRDDSARRSY